MTVQETRNNQNKEELEMNCNNKTVGCYHDNSIHLDGNGKCIVKGCKCEKFVS